MAKKGPFEWCARLGAATDDVIGTVLHHALDRWRASGVVSVLHRVDRYPGDEGEYVFLSVALVWDDAPPLDAYAANPSAYRAMQGDIAARFDRHAAIEPVSRDTAIGLKRAGWYVLTKPVELPQMPMLYSGSARPAKPASAPRPPPEPVAPPPTTQRSLF